MSSAAGTTQPKAPASVASTQSLALYVVHPPELARTVIELLPGVVIGREHPNAPGAQCPGRERFVALEHSTVSRRHAAIEGAFGVPIVTDLASRNGTRVNGVTVSAPTPLVVQSVVRLGDVLGVVDISPRHAPAIKMTEALPGSAPAIELARAVVLRAASDFAPVLVHGETGTGKERVAAEVHKRSGRTGQYVKFSCAELSAQLVESQLFGHERGAFTGATAASRGLFAQADKGTLFLDEVGELPLDLQPKLLRAIQEQEIRPLGGARAEPVDVRVVSATNRDLAQEVEAGRFRRDLYARLSYFEVRLPPLRERRQDLLFWVNLLADAFADERGVDPRIELKADAAELFLLHAFPENLRAVDRFVHRALSAESRVPIGRSLLLELMPECASSATGPADAEDSAIATAPRTTPSERPSREEFLAVYEANGRSVRATSKHFGKDRRQVYRWLELFGIERDE
jgi:transcriptional regulator with GAF, ATPase, and Fis domain